MLRLALVSVWFQVLWFMTVLGQTTWQWWSMAALGAILVVSMGRQASRWRWWLGITATGIVLDSANTLIGIFQFPSVFIPVWLMVLWGAFAWYSWYLIPVIARWPRVVQLVGSGLSGGLSYLAGAHWQAVVLPHGHIMSVVILMLEWAILIQCMIWKKERADG